MSNILTITGDINLDTYKMVLDFIKNLGPIDTLTERKKITIIINSCGGSVTYGFSIYDLLTMCNFDITTIAIGCCESIATILFSLGNKRYITPNSIFSIHSAAYRVENLILTESDAMEKFNTIRDDNQKIIKCYLNSYNFKMSKRELDHIFSSGKDYTYSALEAIEKGFATDILTDLKEIM